MIENNSQKTDESQEAAPDGGVATGGSSADYLNAEVNLLSPSTPFMRDHLKLIWSMFTAWALIVFGPVTLTAIAPDVMTTTMPLVGFPLHYFLVAIGAPAGALVLSFIYARKRDQLDEKYGIDHTDHEQAASGAPVADGGVEE